jgi:glycine oxidase
VRERDLEITVVGAGIFGLWQALVLARTGHRVRLIEASTAPFAASASQWAGAMLAPECEAEAAPEIVRRLGREAVVHWRATYPALACRGSIVVAAARDRSELTRFSRMTEGGRTLDATALAALEPALAARFSSALYFPDEAHMATPHALAYLLDAVRAAGGEVNLGRTWHPDVAARGYIIDCRGIAARCDLPGLRGVRGERLLLRSRDVQLQRPVRLLHPRVSFYMVPWGGGVHMVGATVIESEDTAAMTARSALELLGLAYALHPTFGEAEIVELGSGVRPAFADNIPRAIVRGRTIHVNGAFRHGFLLAPIMAAAVAHYVADGAVRDEVMTIERSG